MKKNKGKKPAPVKEKFDVKENLKKLKGSGAPRQNKIITPDDSINYNESNNSSLITSDSSLNIDKYTIEKIDKVNDRISDFQLSTTESISTLKDILTDKMDAKISIVKSNLETDIDKKVSNLYFRISIGVATGFVSLVYLLSYQGVLSDVNDLKKEQNNIIRDTIYIKEHLPDKTIIISPKKPTNK